MAVRRRSILCTRLLTFSGASKIRHAKRKLAPGHCAKSAVERLKYADERVESAERAQRETIHEANCKLQDASRALQQAELRITAAEELATAAEFRAQAADIQLQKTNQELALIEEAIRRRLLCASPEAVGKPNAA
jgi:hypothetical protein